MFNDVATLCLATSASVGEIEAPFIVLPRTHLSCPALSDQELYTGHGEATNPQLAS
jgi:hypothetical protein